MKTITYKSTSKKMPVFFKRALFLPFNYSVKTYIYILILSYFLIGHAALAAEKTDFKVNNDAGTASQTNPKIAVAPDRSFVITWIDKRSGENDVYIQRFDSSGNPLGSNLIVNDDADSSHQNNPALAVDFYGNYSLTFKDYRNGDYPFDPDIYFQKFDSTFTRTGNNLNISASAPVGFKETPDIAISSSGLGVVVWADYRNSNWDIYGQLIQSDGSPIGSNFLINDDVTAAQQHAPRVSMSNQGWFVVTWYDNRNAHDDIFIQVYDTLGNKLDSNVKVNQDLGLARQAFPDVSTDGAGYFTVVWVDWRNGTYPANPDIYSRKYDASMNSVTSEHNINQDGSGRAQREPAISSDRLGNVAIIWADSINKSWDISGQMIDVDGVVREANFTANSDTDSSQVSPDVALDGQFRYLTWVDRRNGNYDIYASIQKYNDPSIGVSKIYLQYEMQDGGMLPPGQSVRVDHIGYNPLQFKVVSNVDWLSITPDSSTTPDSILVSVNTDTLSGGVYFGTLEFNDLTNNDSSVAISVRLDVYTPTMELSRDTISLTVFENIPDTIVESVVILNSSLGTFNWTVTENIDWISMSSNSGTAYDTVAVTITPAQLTAGTTYEHLVFNSVDAAGSPDTLVIEVEVVNNQPYLQASPDSVFLYVDSINGMTLDIVVNNAGIGNLNWSAEVDAVWAVLSRNTGGDEDTISIPLSTLSIGRHQAVLTITDTAAFNNSIRVPLIVEYFKSSTDTVKISSTTVEAGKTGSISLTVQALSELLEINQPLKFDTSYIKIDSILPGLSHPEILDITYQIDNLNGTAIVDAVINSPDTFLVTGESHLAEIYFTAGLVIGTTTIDSMLSDLAASFVLDSSGTRFAPQFDSGVVVVTIATGIEDNPTELLPQSVSLSQNYPNPFNLSTKIEFSIPENSMVEINLYNILGQKVAQLLNSFQPAGEYLIEWNGRTSSGQEAPSGVYFYRLEAQNSVLVKKMMLLK